MVMKACRKRAFVHCVIGILSLGLAEPTAPAATDVPYLAQKGTATQLIVDGKPFIMIHERN